MGGGGLWCGANDVTDVIIPNKQSNEYRDKGNFMVKNVMNRRTYLLDNVLTWLARVAREFNYVLTITFARKNENGHSIVPQIISNKTKNRGNFKQLRS